MSNIHLDPFATKVVEGADILNNESSRRNSDDSYLKFDPCYY